MRVDAAEIRGLQNSCGSTRVFLRNAHVPEDANGELEELLRRKELCLGHVG